MAWKPDKAPGRKREQKQRRERQQKRKDFAKNMEQAEALASEYLKLSHAHPNMAAVKTGGLEQKYVDWALSRYDYLKFCTPMSSASVREASSPRVAMLRS